MELSTAPVCVKCSRPLPEQSGPGRPTIYCSTACRRAVEYELRRVQSALEQVEDQVRACRFGWYGRTPEHAVAYEAERERLEGRLRLLLGGDD